MEVYKERRYAGRSWRSCRFVEHQGLVLESSRKIEMRNQEEGGLKRRENACQSGDQNVMDA